MRYLTVREMRYLMVRDMRYLTVYDLRYRTVQSSFLTVFVLVMKYLIPHTNNLVYLIVLNLGYLIVHTCST